MAGMTFTSTHDASTTEYRETRELAHKDVLVHTARVQWRTHRSEPYHAPRKVEVTMGGITYTYEIADSRRGA